VLVALNKPFGVISKFSPAPGKRTLADYVPIPGIYPAGRLDTDSEGLLLLTDDGALQARIADPRHKLAKTYWAQVEGVPTDEAIASLRAGIDLGDFVTKPARVRRIDEPGGLWTRYHRSATARRSRRRGSSSPCAKARTARSGA